MKRLLANAIMMASGIAFSSQLMALGLGELTLDSALNQPLKASIELTDTKGLTEWDIKPSLASQADFDRAGVDRDFFLTSIKFKIEGNKIVLTTKDAVNEPFLNFLLELNWPSGRVLREYTVLLDPPTFAETNYQPLVYNAEVAEEVEEVVAVQPESTNQWQETAAPGSYKVQPNDTLWAIALQTRPSSDVTPQQMMLALQQENPEAFISGNINRLKSYTVLNIPSEEVIRNIRQENAIAEVARQNKSLHSSTAQIDATGLKRNTNSAPSSSGGEVRLVSATSAASKEAGSSGDAAALNDSQQRQSLENDLAIALENADKSARENKELRERLDSLQEQIDILQGLVNLKNDQLANLQAGQEAVATAEEQQPVDFNYEEEPKAEETTAKTTDEQAAEERRKRIAALMAEQEEIQEPELLDELFQLLENPAILGGGAAGLLLILLLIARALKKRKAEEPEEVVEFNDPALLDDIENSSDELGNFDFDVDADTQDQDQNEFLAEDEQDGFYDDLDSAEANSDVLADVERSLAYGQKAEALLLLENAILEHPERLDLRLKQLELISEKDDEEAFFTAEIALNAIDGSEAVADQVSELRSRLTAPIDPMDQFENFDNDLAEEFSGGLDFADALEQSEEISAQATPEQLEPDVLPEEPTFDSEPDLELAAEVPTLELEDAADNAATTDDVDALEFDLDDFDFQEPLTNEDLAVDVDDVPEQEDETEAVEIEATLPVEEESPEIPVVEEIAEEVAEEAGEAVADDALEFENFEDFDFDAPLESESEPELKLDDGIESLESILDGNETGSDEIPDLDFDFNEEVEQEAADANTEEVLQETADFAADDIDLESLAEADDEFDFLAGTDECATKLDLARAYIDMEDAEGAKELLQEVIQEGNEAQQSEARELINNL